MTKLNELIEGVVTDVVSEPDTRVAIFQAIQIEEKFGNSKSVDVLDKYEKIIEGLIR